MSGTGTNNNKKEGRGALRPCPTCGKLATKVDWPFCSKRCADVDLGRWLNDSYRIPTNEGPDDAKDEAED